MKKLFLLLFFSIFLYADSNTTIKNIAFHGNDKFFTAVLKEAIGIEGESFYKFWKKLPEYERDDMERMESDIVEFYHSKGFFNATVESEIKGDSLLFNISENDRMKVVSVEMQSPFYIKNMIALKPNDYFDADLFVKSKENIKKYLNENGMPKAKFSAKAYIDPVKYEAKLEFNITDATVSKFGDIHIGAVDDIDEERIKEKLFFNSGQEYDSRKIDESYKSLYATGAFETVSIKPMVDQEGESVPVDINLTASKQRSFKLGAGYDTDEGARIKGGWLHKNFYGNLKRFEAIAELSDIRQTVGAKISIPRVFGFEFEDLAKYEKLKYPGFTEKITSNAFKFKIPYKTTTHYLGLLMEIGSVCADEESDKIENKDFVINALTYEYTIERRDSVIDAKEGYFVGWNVEFADNMLGSSINYLKTNLETKAVLGFSDNSYFRDFLFGARVNIGGINDFKKNDIPVFKRYFAGGSFSNRGYSYRKLGQKDSHGNYIGGNSLIDYSLEARYKTTKSLWGVLFFDSTLLNEKSLVFNGDFKYSIGTGVRYDTIVGPIRFDIGVPLTENKRSPVYHISFGQAF